MKCPVDKTDLEPKNVDGFTCHECPECEGLWLEAQSLKTFADNADLIFPDLSKLASSQTKPSARRLFCPHDTIALHEFYYNAVELDICRSCAGIWLDKGEIEKIQNQVNSSEDAGTQIVGEFIYAALEAIVFSL